MPRLYIRQLFIILGIIASVSFLCSFFLQGEKSSELTNYRHKSSKGRNDTCNLQWDKITSDPAFPHCLSKIEWMNVGWQTDGCYASYGVDGSNCSFYEYLSTVENHCPPSSSNVKASKIVSLDPSNVTFEPLFQLMVDNPTNYEFIKSRISRLLGVWRNALYDLIRKTSEIKTRKKLNIIMYMGFLSKETGLKFGEKSKHGGPLGELVQWSDLIASCSLLGHNINIASEFQHFKEVAAENFRNSNSCPQLPGKSIDLIFTDIVGLRKIKQRMKSFFVANKCRVRLLDSFGTHAEFNHPSYFNTHWKELGNRRTNPWGKHGLELQQFLTLYPHSDDNSFLGFVVETYQHDTASSPRQNITLVYGKEKYMWNNTEAVLPVVQKYTSIHATVADADENFMKDFGIVNHNLLSGREFHALLRKSKIFLGLGFPLEGPAPLEAISNGAIYINHRFNPPKSRLSYKFFEDKPTLRELSSQNPYMERFVGEPHVITCDVFNSTDLEMAYLKAMAFNPEPLLPFEFSALGMLERVDVILTRHDFCGSEAIFPPWSSAKIIIAEKGESCQDACQKEGFICERSFFPKVNTKEMISKFSKCEVFTESAIPSAPSTCTLQTDPLLYSCASHAPSDIQRICPCRTFQKGQIVLP